MIPALKAAAAAGLSAADLPDLPEQHSREAWDASLDFLWLGLISKRMEFS